MDMDKNHSLGNGIHINYTFLNYRAFLSLLLKIKN